jgi:predicted RNA binding protein YcfA (HicA-like mRNA interferase family)
MPTSGKDMVKLLLRAGWTVVRIKGSHTILRRDGKTVVVPVHGNRDLKMPLEKALRRQTGLDSEE